jgi:hypothetical protein
VGRLHDRAWMRIGTTPFNQAETQVLLTALRIARDSEGCDGVGRATCDKAITALKGLQGAMDEGPMEFGGFPMQRVTFDELRDMLDKDNKREEAKHG